MVDFAIAEDVDFILLVGDLFDSNYQSAMVQTFLVDQFNRLNENEIHVYISFGDSDYLTSVTDHLSWPDNIHVFEQLGAKTVQVFGLTSADDKKVAIAGFSYQNKWKQSGAIAHFPKHDVNADFQIGTYHGENNDNSNSNFAPFNIQEMLDKGYDYWALGHQHNRGQALNENPFIGYSGTMQGLNQNETGPKGFLYFNDEEQQTKPRFIPTSPIEWQRMNADAGHIQTEAQLVDAILNTIEQQNPEVLQLIVINFNRSENIPKDVYQRIESGETLNLLNQEIAKRFNDFYVAGLTMNYTTEIVNLNKLDDQYWEKSIDVIFSAENINHKLVGTDLRFLNDYFTHNSRIELLENKVQVRLIDIQNNNQSVDES